MKRIVCCLGAVLSIAGCSSLPPEYKKAEAHYEELLSSGIDPMGVKRVEEEYRSILNRKSGTLSTADKEKIEQRLQVLEDLQD